MTFQPTANQVHEVAEKYNYTLSKVKDAMVKLGHAEGEVIDRYLQTRGQAVIRYIVENGVKRRMTDEDFANQFRKPCHTPETPPKKDY